MTDRKQRLLRESRALFFELGFSRVSMDEIAAQLGMSKRTIYQLIPSKRELLREALLDKVKELSEGLESIIEARGLNFIHKLHRVGLFMLENLPQPSRHFLRDMEQNCASIWQEVDGARGKVIRERFRSLFQQGRDQHILRKDIDSRLVVHAFLGMIQSTMRPDVLAHMPVSLTQAFGELFDLICLGMLSPAGRTTFMELEDTSSGSTHD